MNKKKVIVFIVLVLIIIAIAVSLIIYLSERAKYIFDVEYVSNIEYNIIEKDGSYGVIDGDGNIVVEPTYNVIQIPNPSKPLFICMSNYNTETKEYETKVLNEKREQIITGYSNVQAIPTDSTADGVPYENTVLKYKKDGKYGIISTEGEEITEPIYEDISAVTYKEGMLLVKENGKYGVININGKVVIKPEYDNITVDNYYDAETKYQKTGFIVCNINEEGYRYGYVDYRGKKILDTIEFVEPEKSYVEYYMENNTETNLETVRVYEDNTVTVQITQRTIEMFKDSEYVKMQPNVEYEITGINSKILRIEFMGDMAGGAYQGSYVFIYDENNELYLLDMNRGITECEFEVTKIEIENRATNPEFKVISEESGLERPIVVVYNQAGQGYIISRDGSLEEYVEKQENDNQEQTTQQNTTDAKAKEVIQKYLSMSGIYEGEPAGMLTTELPDYITANLDLEDTFIENGISYVNTNASYDDFEREMTKYMSYEIFNQYFLKYKNHINPFRNVNGLLYVAQVAGSGAFYDVIEVERMNRNGNEYTYNAYANEIYGDITRKVTFSIKLVEIDGNMIVTYVGIG